MQDFFRISIISARPPDDRYHLEIFTFPFFSFLFNYRAAGGIVRPRSGLPFGVCTGSGVLFIPFEFQKKVSRRGKSATIPFEGEGKRAEILGTMEKELKKIRSGAYRTAQEIRGKADAEATRIYGLAYSRDADFYTFYKTLDTYKAASINNAYIILSTDSDYYKYLKKIWK